MPQVDIPGYGQVEFPEGMADEQIESAIQTFLKEEALRYGLTEGPKVLGQAAKLYGMGAFAQEKQAEERQAKLESGWSPYETAQVAATEAGMPKPQAGMEPGTDLTAAIARPVVGGAMAAAGLGQEIIGQMPAAISKIGDIPGRIGATLIGKQPGQVDFPEPRPPEDLIAFNQAMQKPFVQIPRIPVFEGDPALKNWTLEIANFLISIPEFLESGYGVATLGAGKVLGPAGNTMIRLGFAAQIANQLRQEAPEVVANWEKMTPNEKRQAIVQGAGSLALIGALTKGKGGRTPFAEKDLRTGGEPIAPEPFRLGPGKRPIHQLWPEPLPPPMFLSGAGEVGPKPPIIQPTQPSQQEEFPMRIGDVPGDLLGPIQAKAYAEGLRRGQRPAAQAGIQPEAGKEAGSDQLLVPTREAGEAPQAPIAPAAPGMVRLYHGQGGAEGAGMGAGLYWSEDINRAATHGPDISYVDVPEALAGEMRSARQAAGSGTGKDYLLTDVWAKRAKPFGKVEQKVYEPEAPPVAPEAPAPAQTAPEKPDAPAPAWMRQNVQSVMASLPKETLLRIESLAAQRKTAAEIAKELGLDEGQVRSARIGLKIPSQTIGAGFGPQRPNPEFEAWIKSKQTPKPEAAPKPASLREQLEAIRAPRMTQEDLNAINAGNQEARARREKVENEATLRATNLLKDKSDQELIGAMATDNAERVQNGEDPFPVFMNGAKDFAAIEWLRRKRGRNPAAPAPPRGQATLPPAALFEGEAPPAAGPGPAAPPGLATPPPAELLPGAPPPAQTAPGAAGAEPTQPFQGKPGRVPLRPQIVPRPQAPAQGLQPGLATEVDPRLLDRVGLEGEIPIETMQAAFEKFVTNAEMTAEEEALVKRMAFEQPQLYNRLAQLYDEVSQAALEAEAKDLGLKPGEPRRAMSAEEAWDAMTPMQRAAVQAALEKIQNAFALKEGKADKLKTWPTPRRPGTPTFGLPETPTGPKLTTPAEAEAMGVPKAPADGKTPDDWKVFVQSGFVDQGKRVGGYVQVDDFKGGDKWSTNPDTLRSMGYDIPAVAEILDRVPQGTYTVAELRKLMEAKPAEAPSGETLFERWQDAEDAHETALAKAEASGKPEHMEAADKLRDEADAAHEALKDWHRKNLPESADPMERFEKEHLERLTRREQERQGKRHPLDLLVQGHGTVVPVGKERGTWISPPMSPEELAAFRPRAAEKGFYPTYHVPGAGPGTRRYAFVRRDPETEILNLKARIRRRERMLAGEKQPKHRAAAQRDIDALKGQVRTLEAMQNVESLPPESSGTKVQRTNRILGLKRQIANLGETLKQNLPPDQLAGADLIRTILQDEVARLERQGTETPARQEKLEIRPLTPAEKSQQEAKIKDAQTALSKLHVERDRIRKELEETKAGAGTAERTKAAANLESIEAEIRVANEQLYQMRDELAGLRSGDPIAPVEQPGRKPDYLVRQMHKEGWTWPSREPPKAVASHLLTQAIAYAEANRHQFKSTKQAIKTLATYLGDRLGIDMRPVLESKALMDLVTSLVKPDQYDALTMGVKGYFDEFDLGLRVTRLADVEGRPTFQVKGRNNAEMWNVEDRLKKVEGITIEPGKTDLHRTVSFDAEKVDDILKQEPPAGEPVAAPQSPIGPKEMAAREAFFKAQELANKLQYEHSGKQHDYQRAVEKYGKRSPEARQAAVEMQEAWRAFQEAWDAQTAALEAAEAAKKEEQVRKGKAATFTPGETIKVAATEWKAARAEAVQALRDRIEAAPEGEAEGQVVIEILGKAYRFANNKETLQQAVDVIGRLRVAPKFGLLPLGADLYQEFLGPGETRVSNMRMVVDLDRLARGAKPQKWPPARRTWRQDDALATARMHREPDWIPNLIQSFLIKPRPPDSIEIAGITFYKAYVRGEFNNALMEANQAYEDGRLQDRDIKQREAAHWESKLNEIESAMGPEHPTEPTGGATSELGRALRATRQMMGEDFTLVEAIHTLRAEQGGKPLSERQMDELRNLVQKHHLAWKATQAANEGLKDRLAQEQLIRIAAEAKAERGGKYADYDPRVMRYAEEFVTRLEKAGDEALKRAIQRATGGGGKDVSMAMDPSKLDPRIVSDLTIWAASKIARYSWDLAKTTVELVKELGEAFRPHAKTIYDAADKYLAEQAKLGGGHRGGPRPKDLDAEIKRIKDSIMDVTSEPGYDLTTFMPLVDRLVRRLFDKYYAEHGVETTREWMIEEVRKALEPAIPDITWDIARDIFCHKGEWRQLSKDRTSVVIRDWRGISQQETRLKDIIEKKPTPKFGGERRVPSQEERKGIEKVNEAKRKYGVVVTNPETQIKSALDAKKTWYRHQMADMRTQIREGVKWIREKTESPMDDELRAMIAEYKTVVADFNSIFKKPGLTDEQRLQLAIKAAQRNQEFWEKRRDDAKKGKWYKRVTRKFNSAQLQAIHDKTEAAKAEVRHLESLDIALQEAKQAKVLLRSIADYEAQVQAGEARKRKEPAELDTPRLNALRVKRTNLRTMLANIRNASPEVLAAEKANVMEAIDTLIEEINTGQVEAAKPKGPRISDPELAALRAERDELYKIKVKLRNAAKPKRTAEEIGNAQLQAMARREIAKLQDRMAKGQFEPIKKPERQWKVTKQSQDSLVELEKWRDKFAGMRHNARLQNRRWWEKGAAGLVAMRRGFVLSGLRVIPKLMSAGLQRMISYPLEQLAGDAWKLVVPGVREIADEARVEGGPMRLWHEANAWQQAATQGMVDALNVLKTGKSELDLMYGKGKFGYSGELEGVSGKVIQLAEFPGWVHGAIKSPVKRYAYQRAYLRLLEWHKRNDPTFDEFDEMNRAKLGIEAYKAANRSIFLQDNAVVRLANTVLAHRIDPETGRPYAWSTAATGAGRFLLPIIRVPTNIVAETFQYALGVPTALGRYVIPRAIRRALGKEVEKLSPDKADMVMRMLKKGSLGGALLLVGYFNPDSVGGFIEPGRRREPGDVKPGALRLGHGIPDIPYYVLHNPLLMTLQVGATYRRASDSYLRRSDLDPRGIPGGLWAAAIGLIEETPFVREMFELEKLRNVYTARGAAHQLVAGTVVPSGVAQAGDFLEWAQRGGVEPRKPETVGEAIEAELPAIPPFTWLGIDREQVPIDWKRKARE